MLVVGLNAQAAAQAASAIAGVAKVIHVEGEAFAHGLAEKIAGQVLAPASADNHLLFRATASGKTSPREWRRCWTWRSSGTLPRSTAVRKYFPIQV